MNAVATRRSGLARPEILFLGSILLLAGSIALPVAIEGRNHRYAGRAFAEMRMVLTAADFYQREYRLWPVPDANGRNDTRLGWGRGNAAVLRILHAADGADDLERAANPGRIDFIALARETGAHAIPDTAPSGEWLDPWGRPYQIVFDTNYDNIVEIAASGFSSVVGEGAVMWSFGPDGKPETSDDVCSWKKP